MMNRRADARVDLRGVHPRGAEKRPHLLEIVLLLEDLHGDTAPQVMSDSSRPPDRV